MNRRSFLKKLSMVSIGFSAGSLSKRVHAFIPFGFIRRPPALMITLNGGTNLNITSSWLNSNYGWNTTSGPSVIITNTSHILSTSTSTAALIINVTMPAGKTLQFINSANCYIAGKGGIGAIGNASCFATNGSAGGPAIQALTAVKITNSGVIGGGGGGGGNGATGSDGGGPWLGGTGGNGSSGPGSPSTSGTAGGSGTGGAGGAGGLDGSGGTVGDPNGGRGGGGGGGGGIGAGGGSGNSGGNCHIFGNGGYGGAALVGTSFVNSGAGITGTVYGPQS